MLNRFEKSIQNEQLINAGDRVLCAVSGGADSVALLVLLNQLSERLDFTLSAVHLDHCLRTESGADASFVTSLCATLQVPVTVESIDVQALSVARGEGLEATGRFARRSCFERVVQEQSYTSVALAHHADDQAETVLFRLLRGSGLTGLVAMRPCSGLYIRPLLSFKKLELRDWLVANGIEWREDASNIDSRFSRNRIRNQIMPGLRHVNRQVDSALCRFSQQVALEEGFWREQVEVFLSQYLVKEENGALLIVPVARLHAIHPALRRRVLRGMLERLRGDLQQIDSSHIDQIDALLASSRPQVETSLPDAWVARRYDLLQMRSSPPAIEVFTLTLQQQGTCLLPNGDRLTVTLQPDSEPADDVVEFCAEQFSFPLTIRSVRPGDRFQPSGMTGHKRLKDYFIDNKLPSESRRQALVVCSGITILWLVGDRRCGGFQPVNGKPVLRIRLERTVFVDE